MTLRQVYKMIKDFDNENMRCQTFAHTRHTFVFGESFDSAPDTLKPIVYKLTFGVVSSFLQHDPLRAGLWVVTCAWCTLAHRRGPEKRTNISLYLRNQQEVLQETPNVGGNLASFL